MITQEELAKKIGVSRTTVARALNGSNNIKPDTKEKILKLAKELGYVKNYIGSSLALKSDRVVYAFIAKSKNENYTSEIKRGLRSAYNELKEYNFQLEIIETDINDPWEQLKTLEIILKTKKPDGIIITPLDKERVVEILSPYLDTLKVVSIGKNILGSIFHVEPNYYKSGRVAGDIMGNILKHNDNILIIDGGDDNLSSKKYLDGFYERLDETNNNLEGPIYIEDILSHMGKILDYITPNTKGFYINRYATEIVDFLFEKNIKDLKIVTNGLNKNIRKLIKEDKITATVMEEIYEQGYVATKHIFNMIYKGEGEKQHSYNAKIHILFKENIDNF
ncbi:substrate-binding domain-containing protein [Cetobacterium sp. SF1]|uniref:substrate-binding domain-containing protein n=1 Tax=unclassified Cetobacterium TaxID=2630983 RepID=UPI003CF4AAE4